MTRRAALLTVAALTANATKAHTAPLPPGLLTLDLGQWKAIVVKWKGQEYAIAPDELWDALRGSV